MNVRSKKIDLIFISGMLLPFTFKSTISYLYWITLAIIYLAYVSWRWKV